MRYEEKGLRDMSFSGMTSRERLLCAMRGLPTDRVPFQLGITNMFSVFLKGYTGWDIYLNNKEPLWKMVADIHRQFGLDGYLYIGLTEEPDPDVQYKSAVVHSDAEKVIVRTTMQTPEGDLWSESTYMKNETPTVTRGYIKDEDDFALWIKYALRPKRYTCPNLPEIRAYMGEDGVVAGSVGGVPGYHNLMMQVDGKLENTVYLHLDYPELFEEYVEKAHRLYLSRVEQAVAMGFDYIEMSNSGMIALGSPEMFRKYSLPTIKEASRIIRQAGSLSEVHCCGPSLCVVKACHDETDVDSINPIQEAPMGDCSLPELKKLYGDTLCLKGNVGVIYPLLEGTPEDVEKHVIRCMDAAKENGRFILFGDEGVSSRTPVENVKAYVDAALRYGKY